MASRRIRRPGGVVAIGTVRVHSRVRGGRAGSAEDRSPSQDVRVRRGARPGAARRRPGRGPRRVRRRHGPVRVRQVDAAEPRRRARDAERRRDRARRRISSPARTRTSWRTCAASTSASCSSSSTCSRTCRRSRTSSLAAVIAGVSRRRAETRARELLDLLGLADKAAELPAVLSGGQRQRLAIARALANEPTLLLADEPTGALDSEGGLEVLELFRRLHAGGQTILLVTHDERVADAADARGADAGRARGRRNDRRSRRDRVGGLSGRRLAAVPTRASLALARLARGGAARRSRGGRRAHGCGRRPPHSLCARAPSRRVPLPGRVAPPEQFRPRHDLPAGDPGDPHQFGCSGLGRRPASSPTAPGTRRTVQ